MILNELLLQNLSFKEILKRFSISPNAFTVKDEEVILAKKELNKLDILKERIFIQGKTSRGLIINFFGTLHYNPLNQLSVFDLDFVEQVT